MFSIDEGLPKIFYICFISWGLWSEHPTFMGCLGNTSGYWLEIFQQRLCS